MFRRLFFFTLLFVSYSSLHAAQRTLLILGDSLSAAYGIPLDSGWAALLSERLAEQDYAFQVVNASISGETTLGARTRLEGILERHKPDITIIELGGNDGLRGFPLTETKQNLATIISLLIEKQSRIILVPIQLPPNYGQVYNDKFREIYESLSQTYSVSLSRFILDQIAMNPTLMQADGIHPVEQAQMQMLDNIWPALLPLLNHYQVSQ